MQFAEDYGGVGVALRVAKQDAMLPLGWTLASPSVVNLDEQVGEQEARFEEVKALLEGRHPAQRTD